MDAMTTWRWLLYSTLIVIVPFSSLFVIGLWFMRLSPLAWWRSVWTSSPPEQYDGKGSYEKWAAQMERARRVQAREEE